MARIIELCGVAGVGKTTIFKEMISRWDHHSDWIPGHFLFPQQKLRFDTLSKLLLSVERKFTTSEGNIDERIMKPYGDRFLANYPEYIDACWHNIFSINHKKGNGPDLRFDKSKYLYHTLQKFQFLSESKTSKATILDEGLIHRLANGLYRQEDPDEEKKEIYNLVQLMPLPDALIYVETDVAEIAKRLYKRKKVIISHKSLNLAALENTSRLSLERMVIVLQNLEKRKVPLLCVDAENDIVTNSNIIISFIEGLIKTDYRVKDFGVCEKHKQRPLV